MAGAHGLHGGGQGAHIAMFSSLHGNIKRKVGRPGHTWEKCGCADLKVIGEDEGSWEAFMSDKECLEEGVVGSYAPLGKPTDSEVWKAH